MLMRCSGGAAADAHGMERQAHGNCSVCDTVRHRIGFLLRRSACAQVKMLAAETMSTG